MEYRFYLNRGRINDSEIVNRFGIIDLHPDSREGRLLQKNVPLSYVPTEIFTGNITKAQMLTTARRLYSDGHDVTVTDIERNKKFERVFSI